MRKISDELTPQEEYYIEELEKNWKHSSISYSDNELLQIFPELKTDIIPAKIKELSEQKNSLQSQIRRTLQYYKIRFPRDYWFLSIWIKHTIIKDLIHIEKQLFYFERLRHLSRGKKDSKRLSDEQIAEANAFPIENIIGQQNRLRKSGRDFVALCPMHQEKTPSFHIYTETNSFYCFGCSQGGNTITLVRLLHNLSFPEAIKYLTK